MLGEVRAPSSSSPLQLGQQPQKSRQEHAGGTVKETTATSSLQSKRMTMGTGMFQHPVSTKEAC